MPILSLCQALYSKETIYYKIYTINISARINEAMFFLISTEV